jgi:hypothetical protein
MLRERLNMEKYMIGANTTRLARALQALDPSQLRSLPAGGHRSPVTCYLVQTPVPGNRQHCHGRLVRYRYSICRVLETYSWYSVSGFHSTKYCRPPSPSHSPMSSYMCVWIVLFSVVHTCLTMDFWVLVLGILETPPIPILSFPSPRPG